MKILIVGIVASGKTTLARKLSKLLDIKHYEIDSVVHDDINDVKRSEAEQKKIFNKINKEDNWIIEGTLRKHLFYLCFRCNLIFSCYNTFICRFEIIKTLIKLIFNKIKFCSQLSC